ncbi:MAG: magnesium transporter CorA [Alphaproteobacteria bacterium]|nr:magnesium transporter CorA [Alphaproteobacteria bacterium]
MIKIYSRRGNTTELIEAQSESDFPSGVAWVDLVTPTAAELDMVQKYYNIEIPSKKEVWKNNVLNRLYAEENIAYMTAALITKSGTPYPDTAAVTFILGPDFLLTVHDIDPTSFRNLGARLFKSAYLFQSSANLAEALFEEMIIRVAYNSEQVVTMLDELSHGIFATDIFLDKKVKNTTSLMKSTLKSLGNAADLNSKINESLHSISRMLIFFKQYTHNEPAQNSIIDMLSSDAQALITQSAFLSDKITFQLDATLGMINVEQNLIIKIFSIFTIFFLPATLVSSIYGMNFTHMPELHWVMGYPFALTLMAICAIVPQIYFRKKGWL